MGKKKSSEHIEGLCLLCNKVPKKDRVISENKDFVCSSCTQYLLEHPRKSGETLEDVLENIKYQRGKMERKVVPDNFWDLTKIKKGTILHDVVKEGYRLLILRGPMAWTTYIGVPLSSPLAHLGYSDEAMLTFACHGGLTYAGIGDDVCRPAGWYYFGWDYGHAGDWSPINAEIKKLSSKNRALRELNQALSEDRDNRDKKWKFSEIKAELEAGFEQLKELAKGISKEEINITLEKLPIVRFGNKKRLIRVSE